MTIPPRFLDELRSRITLSEVVGRKVRLMRAGREFKACCPFHNEKTPSFYVNDDKQFYHCFGCGAHGSAIDFLMSHDNLSFPEAVKSLADEAGMQVPEQSPQEIEKAKKEKDLYALMEDATRWMEAQLRDPSNGEAYRYIHERGLPDELLSAFRVCYAPADRQMLRKHLKKQGYTDAQMIEAGVLRKSDKGGEPYAFFRERIMFPVPDKRGRIVAFGGRILPDHLRPPSRGDYVPAKYMNSPETPLFDKGRMLYGMPHARQAAMDGQPLIVVEGYTDVIACFKGGFRGALAPLGTALTDEQIQVLWRMIPEDRKAPILCFDGDNAGRRAAARAAEKLLPALKPDHSALFAFLPDGQDPDTLINGQGVQAFQGILDSAMPLIDFLWSHHTQGRDFSTPESRAGLSKTLEQAALQIVDRDVQHYYRQAFRDKVRSVFGRSFNAKNGTRFGRRSEGPGYNSQIDRGVTPLRRPAFSRQRLMEMILLASLINTPDIFEAVEERLGQFVMSEKGLDRLRQAVLSRLAQESGLDVSGLCDHLISEGFENELRLVLSDAVYTHAAFARGGQDAQDVVANWTVTWEALNQVHAAQELKAAGAQFAGNLTQDNENKIMAMHSLKDIEG